MFLAQVCQPSAVGRCNGRLGPTNRLPAWDARDNRRFTSSFLCPSFDRGRCYCELIDTTRVKVNALVPLCRGTVTSRHHRGEQHHVILNYLAVSLQYARRIWNPPLIIRIQPTLMT